MSDSSQTSAPQAAETPPERLGLALSGGGFRASFFHLGVLARLADVGVLRHVDVLSTVSGGSIVGAYYYLRLKTLLEEKAAPTDDDYKQLVRESQVEFLAGVRKNMRGRILLNPVKNYRMLGRKYSRSDRIGDLYDRYLYKKAWGERLGRRFLREQQIQLRWLVVKPKGWEEDKGRFDPLDHNAALKAKVPALVMNATTLNTGHNWRFEAVRMGEPVPEDLTAAKLLSTIDVNERLEQAYFKLPGVNQKDPAVPARQQDFPLAMAVAASSCVPLLFHPLSVSDMYLHRRVQLVDGGVHDNQGIQALFDTRCDAVIASDASGLMGDTRKPPPFAFAVAPRSMSIYGTRVRIEQLVRACDGLPTALMHLLRDVPAPTVAPLPKGREVDPGPPLTEYGINRKVQTSLARLRTDLDAFTDAEAYTLMYSGYRMSALEIDQWLAEDPKVKQFIDHAQAPLDPTPWCFAPVVGLADVEHPPAGYLRGLRAGHSLFLKSFLARPLAGKIGWGVSLAAALGAVVWALVDNWGWVHERFNWGWPGWWWFTLIALLPVLLSGVAGLQLLGGWAYLRLGSEQQLRK
jgi:predicted acylesterase/phospholipase RssA